MQREAIIQYVYSVKDRLAGGLLCCGVLLAAYLFQILFPELHIDAFSSSIYLAGWMTLFVGALIWTLRERETRGLPIEIIEWQCVAAFLLSVSDQIYIITPKEIHDDIAPVLSAYTIPTLAIGGLVVAVLIKLATSLHWRLENEREQAVLQARRIQDLLDSPIPEQKENLLVRKLFENESVAQFTNEESMLLIEGCKMLDPILFNWLKRTDFKLSPREIILCVLIRLRKSKEEILSVLGICDGAYRTMKSRIRKHLETGQDDLEAFLKKLQ